MSQYDLPGLFEFITQTPEQGLRKMFVDGKPVTEAHFNLMIKIVRGTKAEDFCNFCEKTDFPKIKMSPGEQKIKEQFWKDWMQAFQSRGVLNPAMPKKAA